MGRIMESLISSWELADLKISSSFENWFKYEWFSLFLLAFKNSYIFRSTYKLMFLKGLLRLPIFLCLCSRKTFSESFNYNTPVLFHQFSKGLTCMGTLKFCFTARYFVKSTIDILLWKYFVVLSISTDEIIHLDKIMKSVSFTGYEYCLSTTANRHSTTHFFMFSHSAVINDIWKVMMNGMRVQKQRKQIRLKYQCSTADSKRRIHHRFQCCSKGQTQNVGAITEKDVKQIMVSSDT